METTVDVLFWGFQFFSGSKIITNFQNILNVPASVIRSCNQYVIQNNLRVSQWAI